MNKMWLKEVITCVMMAILLYSPDVITAQPLPLSEAKASGLSSSKLSHLDKHFAQYVESGKLPGVVLAVARYGKLAHFSQMGFQDIDAQTHISEDTIFRIASMTKIVTSVAVLMLHEEGHFLLSDPISRYIPELANMRVLKDLQVYPGDTAPANREITIHDLLLHTSGLGMQSSIGVGRAYAEAMNDPALSLKDKMKNLGKLPLLYQPGSQWRYSMATTVLGYLVEVVSGVPFEDFLDDRIFDPLGMVDTGFYVPQEKSDRVISVYRVNETDGLSRVREGLGAHESSPPNAPSGAGGLFSTVNDYLRFSQMLLNGGHLDETHILGKKTVALMTTNHLPKSISLPDSFGRNYGLAGYGFGLGVRVRTDVAASKLAGTIGEFGWGGVFETYVLIDPEEELIGIYMTQVRPSSFYPLRREFTTLLYASLVE